MFELLALKFSIWKSEEESSIGRLKISVKNHLFDIIAKILFNRWYTLSSDNKLLHYANDMKIRMSDPLFSQFNIVETSKFLFWDIRELLSVCKKLQIQFCISLMEQILASASSNKKKRRVSATKQIIFAKDQGADGLDGSFQGGLCFNLSLKRPKTSYLNYLLSWKLGQNHCGNLK